MDYDNTNRGVLFPNTKKKSEKSPDYQGNINIEGKVYNLAGWSKTGKKGKYMSLSISEYKQPNIQDNYEEEIF